MAVVRFLRIWGLVIALSLFIFSISIWWVGGVTPGQLQNSSIGGLVPFSDANGYAASAFDEAKNGIWNSWVLRRPLAAAFRTLLMFLSGYSYPGMLLVQACLLSAVSCFATWTVIRWRGLWAGVAFFGLAYIYMRAFAATTLTEPLGVIWALFSVPFLIDALRSSSLPSALLALGATTVALMTRMGGMFTIPALIVWIAWTFGRSRKHKIMVGAAAGAVSVAVLLASFALAKVYGSGPDNTGSNFAYTVCGLTIGTTWDGCPKLVQSEGKTMPAGDAAAEKFLYAMAWQNFQTHPEVLFGRLLSASNDFLQNLPDELFGGYLRATVPDSGIRNTISLVSVIGLFRTFLKRRANGELLLWALLWLGVVASAAVIYFDDGDRALAASYVLIWLFFASGFSTPVAPLQPASAVSATRLRSFGTCAFAAMAVLYFAVPWLAHEFSPSRQFAVGTLPADEAAVLGGRHMSGFLVVADGTALRSDVPTVDMTTFAKIINASHVEDIYQGVIHPEAPKLPFGFVYAPKVDPPPSYYSYIVPPEVIERRDVPAWRFKLTDWNRMQPYSPYWFYVAHAEPLN